MFGFRAQPTLRTERLLLRPFDKRDAPLVQQLAGDADVARGALRIPHPFEDGMAREWIATHAEAFSSGEFIIFAIVPEALGHVVGAVGLTYHAVYQHAELGYWIGRPYWGQGFATEASLEAVRYGFEDVGLHRLHANCLAENASSARVLRKLGMRYEGTQREHVWHWNSFQDLDLYGILASEWHG